MGSPVVLLSSDVEIGVWSAATRTFTATNISPNAVRITAQRTAARGTGIPTTFCSLFGRQNIDAHAVAVASVTMGNTVVNTVYGVANIWLAGMPNGTTANWYDSAPLDTPTTFQGLAITGGAIVNINFVGNISNAPAGQGTLYPPDGDPGWIVDNVWSETNGNAEHGIANIHAPAVSMIGVFLDNTQPDSTAAPTSPRFQHRREPGLRIVVTRAQATLLHRRRISRGRNYQAKHRRSRRRNPTLYGDAGRLPIQQQLRQRHEHRGKSPDHPDGEVRKKA